MSEATRVTAPASLRGVRLVCPLCQAELDPRNGGLFCARCGRAYSLQAGIPDLRVFPDPYLTEDEDRARTERVLEKLEQRAFPELLEYYWSLSEVTPPVLRERFIRSALQGEAKGHRILRILENTLGKPLAGREILEIGSGTGGFLAAAASRRVRIVGTDIAMRWLHLSRRRFMDSGTRLPPLVCCCAEHLPFPDGAFDLVVIAATLEFTRDPERVLAECARVLRPEGVVYLSVVNRFSLASEPHVNLWGVGFLPRAWQAPYVRWRRGASFEKIRLMSFWELDRMAARWFPVRVVAPADLPDELLQQLPRWVQLQVRPYRALKKIPACSLFLRWLGPEWDVLLRRHATA